MPCHGIYPEKLAELYAKNAGEKYRPSNGMEGEAFFDSWCRHCMRDKAMREGCEVDECNDNERCEIIANTMCFNLDDAEYPSEWQYDKDGQPCCTAFVGEGIKIPERDEFTMDMFA